MSNDNDSIILKWKNSCVLDAEDLNGDNERLLAQGRVDNTTNAAVTVTVYITPQTK